MGAKERSAFDRMFDPFIDCLTPEVARRIMVVRADEETTALLDTYAGKNAEGTITLAEGEEYEFLVGVGNVLSLIQAKARAVAAGRERADIPVIVEPPDDT